jgi:general secretion pathway protein K
MQPRKASCHRQRGAALLTAMIIVTLVATLAAAMVWQQWRAVQVEAAERARSQAAWILTGALDFAKLILREDRATYTALTEPWATPLAESRLSTFLAVDKANADEGPEAFLSGNIVDAQSRYNLTNLVAPVTSPAGGTTLEIDLNELATLDRLCQDVGVEAGIAQRIAGGLLEIRRRVSPGAALLPAKAAQLTWLGLDASTAQALEPYIVLLPLRTPVNVNTAPKEVLMAVAGVDGATAEHLMQLRQRTPYKKKGDFTTQLPGSPSKDMNIDVHSDYFEVHGRLRLADRVLVERSLLQRLQNRQSVVLRRERVASLEQVGG